MAYVRQPMTSSYFMPMVITSQQQESQDVNANLLISDSQRSYVEPAVSPPGSSSRETPPPRRLSRQRQPPDKQDITVYLDNVMKSDGQIYNGFHNIKRVLGQSFVN